MKFLKCFIVICLLSLNKCLCFSVFKNLKKDIFHAKADIKNDINKQKVVLDVKTQYKVSSNSTESFIPAATKCKYILDNIFIRSFCFQVTITIETTINQLTLLS